MLTNVFYKEYIKNLHKILEYDSTKKSPAPNAPFGIDIKNCLDETLKIARNLNFKTSTYKGYYGYAEIGEEEKMLGILGHLDIVPFNAKEWDCPPLGGTIKNNTLYGRGVVDDKGPILACLFAVAQLIKEGLKPKMKIRIIFGCDEECGSQCMLKYKEKEIMPDLAFTPDADFPCIHCEKGLLNLRLVAKKPKTILKIAGGDKLNIVMSKLKATIQTDKVLKETDNVKIKKQSNNTYEITAIGKPAHASTPEKGINAVSVLFNYLNQNNIDNEIKKFLPLIETTNGSSLNINFKDNKSGELTLNVGMVTSDKENIIYDVDIRYPVSTTHTQIIKNIQKHFEVKKVLAQKNPLYVSPNSDLVQSLVSSYNETMGQNLKSKYIGGGTYSKFLNNCVAFGPNFPNVETFIHDNNEQMNLDLIYQMYQIYKNAIKKIAF